MSKLKFTAYYILLAATFVLVGWFANTFYHIPEVSNPPIKNHPTPLLKYTIENLSKTEITPTQIQIGEVVKKDPKFTSYKFYFYFDPTLGTSSEQIRKKVSGLINIPNGDGPFPVIVMIRGYVDKKDYFTGNGTLASGEFFAQNGFITISPDFLGYAESDGEANDAFEARFQTYTTAATILKSLDHSLKQPFDYSSVGIWAHSNGGQIALTVLEITSSKYPTVLWAPVSRSFPYSILYYTDEADDHGKSLRALLAKFEEDYDAEKYSLTNYFDLIKAPIQVNQGTNDKEVPQVWSDDLFESLKKATVSATYITYPGNDHNMLPNWNGVVQNNLTFFQKYLK